MSHFSCRKYSFVINYRDTNFDKVSDDQKCDMKLQVVSQQQDTPGASPVGSSALPLDYADSKGPRLPDDKLLQDRHLKLYFCAHPAAAGTIESAAKRVRMVDTVVKHSKCSGVVAVGEIGIDNHRNQTVKARDNCRLFLDALLTALQQDNWLKAMPLVLHVREAEDGSSREAAASQCISALRMAGVPREHRIYFHCFVGSQSMANMKLSLDGDWVKSSSRRWWRVSQRGVCYSVFNKI